MNTSPDIAPALFISHGAPTFALEPGELGQKLGRLGATLDGVRAVVVVSPHWQTAGLRVSSHPTPETIHDFYGFPDALYTLRYPVASSPEAAQMVVTLIEDAGLQARLDPEQGLDHGVWVPLRHLRPEADIPVTCVSLPIDATPQSAWQLGQALAPLRKRNMLILASGSLTHNLSEFRGPTVTEVSPYVTEFARWMKDQVQCRDQASLTQYRQLAPHAVRAHPTEEHLLPLFVALGATNASDQFEEITSEVRYGMLSMASYRWH